MPRIAPEADIAVPPTSPGLRSASCARFAAVALILAVGAPVAAQDSELSARPVEPAWELPEELPEAEKPEVVEPDPVPTGPPQVGLDKLLSLPDSYAAKDERRAGAPVGRWRERFREIHTEIAEAKLALEEAQVELGSAAGSAGGYQVSAPGQSNTEPTPVSFKLREEIRHQRERVDEGEQALRRLEIEADLAEVPEGWRR